MQNNYAEIAGKRVEYSNRIIVAARNSSLQAVNGNERIAMVTTTDRIVAITQRSDKHAWTVEQHEIQAASIANSLFGTQFVLHPHDEFEVPDWDSNLSINHNSEELKLRLELFHIAEEMSTHLNDEEKELLWFWARTHDEGKFREKVVHFAQSYRVVENEWNPMVSEEKVLGSHRLKAMRLPWSDNAHDSEDETKLFWSECAEKGILDTRMEHMLFVLHDDYLVMNRFYKGNDQFDEALIRRDAHRPDFGLLCVILDQLGKGIAGKYFPEEPYDKDRLLETKRVLNIAHKLLIN